MIDNTKIAIVLGGTSPHVNLINNLKERGYYIVLVDYLQNPLGAKVADEHIRESTLDVDKIIEITTEKKADLVISTCIDQANSTCCYVAEKLNLPKPYSYKTSLDVTDKGKMKQIFISNDIPTSKFMIVKYVDDIDWGKVDYPAVVKPVDCNSSKGVHRADSREEIVKYVTEAINLSRTRTAIIEGYNTGFEIQVDCFAQDTAATVIMTRQKQKIISSGGSELQCFGSIIPAQLSEELNIQAKDIASKIARSFKLHNTPFFYQAIVTDKGIQVLEFAPRIGGGLSTYIIKHVTGFDVLNSVIDSFLGNKVSVHIQENRRYYATCLIYMNPGTFDHISGLQEQKASGDIVEYFILKDKGTQIDASMSSGNRVGAFVVEADNITELNEKIKKGYENIEVYDLAGNAMLNRIVISEKMGG